MTKQRIIKSGKEIIVVNCELSQHSQNQLPYFSITGDMGEKRRGPHRQYDMIYTEKAGAFHCYMGGCIHDEIKKYFPELATDLIPLHLSDINGIPMHAVTNALYYMKTLQFDALQSSLRLTEQEYREITRINDADIITNYITEFLFPRYKTEADAAIEKYNLTVVTSH